VQLFFGGFGCTALVYSSGSTVMIGAKERASLEKVVDILKEAFEKSINYEQL
jgi:TATA-box binding protein (TBP) (component of TFIID and TFIIIB)